MAVVSVPVLHSRDEPSEPKANILLVDDEAADRRSVRTILDALGQNIVEAQSGKEALELVKDEPFAVVLLDVRMPAMSGFETASLIRGNDRSRRTPIIFLAANDIERSQLEEAYALGAADFLVKPLLPVVVQAKVRGFVELFQDRQRARIEANQLRLLVQGTTDYAIFMLDPSGRIATWNAGAERLKGYKADEIIGEHFSEFYPQDAIDRGWPTYELKVAKAQGRFEDEGWRVRKDGTKFWANVVITALNDSGRFCGFSKITRDMTERKKAEEKDRRLLEETTARRVAEENARLLQEQHERLHVTLASIGDAVISTDSQGRVTFLNPVAHDLVGWKPEEATNQPLTDVFRIVNESTRQTVENPALRALKEGVIVGLANHTILISKDGTERPIDDSAAPIRDAGGSVIGSVLVFRDISEHKRSEAALNERMRLLTLSAAVGAALVRTESLQTMLQRCAEALMEQLDGAFARIWTLNAQDNVLELQASAGLYTHLDGPHSRVPVGEFKIGLIAQERQPHLTNSVVGDPRVSDQEWARREGMVAFAGYPLIVEDRLVGVMAMFARRPLSAATLEAMASVANEIGLGVQRKEAQERLREQQEWLRVTLASIGDAVIATDTQGGVTFLNSVAEELTGWTQDDSQGQPLNKVFPIVNERTRLPVENPVDKVLRDGTIVGLANHTVLIAKDGTERLIDDSAAPIRDGRGEMIGVVLTFRDVTEQRRAEDEIRASEGRKRAILETALDCIVSMDHEGKVVDFNPAAEKTFGFRREQVMGRELAHFIIPPSFREGHRKGMAHYLATGHGPVLGKRLELTALHADGREFPVELAITRISTDGPPLFTAYLRDISEAKRAERLRNLRLAATSALNGASSADDGAKGVLRSVCEHLGWDVGFFWSIHDDRLTCRASWRSPDEMATEFEKSSCSRTFEEGEGLPGRVWASGEPAWILDIAHDANFPRLAAAVLEGLHSAFAYPIVVADRTHGVIEFFTKRIREADADLLETMSTLAGNVGQFIERKVAEEELLRSEQELTDFFENATIGLHWVGADGTILRANRTELDMLGYSQEEYVGRPIADFHADEEVICDILQRLKGGEKLAEYPARLRCKDGSIKDVLIDSSVLWQDGRFVRTRCFTRDVTERKRAEDRVREQEQRTRTILESVTDAFFGLGRDWRFTYVNRQAEALLGRTRDDLLGKNIWEEYAPAKGTDFERGYRRAMVENVTVTFEAFYPPHDRWYEVHVYPSPEGLSVYFRDVGERKRAEIALLQQERRFRELADAMPQIVWTAGPEGRIDYLNSRWHEFTGLPQTVGNESWGSLLHPEEAPEAKQRWAASVRTGAPFEMELRLRDRKTQSYRWHLIRTVGVQDERGAVLRWFGTSTDIHEQKRAEESSRFLAEASAALAGVVDYENTLQKVVNLAVPHFADWSAVDMANGDESLRRLAVAHQNADKITLAHELMQQYPPDPKSARGAFAVLRTGKPEMVAEITDDMLVQGAKDERHLQLIRSLGLRSYICVPLVVSGKPLGVLTFATAESGRTYTHADLALANDLAHRAGIAIENTQLYQALREADRRKDEFLATLAHELRNPLAPIRNALQILKMPRVDAATVDRSREMMERQVHHLVRLVDDLLDVSRVMRGKIELRREKIELATVVARAVETVQPLVEAQRHELNIALPSESLLLDADPVRIAQVVGNLLTNAAKYMEPNGRIWLTAERDRDMAVLRIRDNGIGIAPALLPRIFELFVQADHASTKAQGGLGIGLTLVKNLVEMHNGRVEARSDGLCKGSEFVVRLPISPRTLGQDHSRDVEQEVHSTPLSSGYRLLVVDDNQDAANSLAMLLKLQGHEVRIAYSGMGALEMTKTYTPDVVFMDIGMPGMDGYEAARRIREQPGLGSVVLAALTGWGQQEVRRRTAEAGFNHHLVKPPEPKAVETVLVSILKRP